MTEEVLRNVFIQLNCQRVLLEGMILKPNMVLPGLNCITHSIRGRGGQHHGEEFMANRPRSRSGNRFPFGRTIRRTGLGPLNTMNLRFNSRLPWALSFSFARAIQQPALEIWQGKEANVPAATAGVASSRQVQSRRAPRRIHCRDGKSVSQDAQQPNEKTHSIDLDGTLAESKASLDAEMAKLLTALLGIVKVAVISGGDWPQFEKQVLANLPHDEHLKNLSLLPTCGTKFYQYANDWKKIYSEDFTADEKKKIIGSLKQALEAAGFKAEKVWEKPLKTGAARSRFPHWGSRRPSRKNGILISASGRRSRHFWIN